MWPLPRQGPTGPAACPKRPPPVFPEPQLGSCEPGDPELGGSPEPRGKRWAPWYGPCPAISRALEEINSEREGLRLVKLDIDDNLPLPLGVAGHEGSTILVALNGLRLLRRSEWTAGRGQLMRDSEATRQ